MKDLKGKTAFITGGASGIGLAMGEAFAREGMNIVLADIERAALEAAASRISALQAPVLTVAADVARRDSLRAAALAAIARFGKVHLVCNNAGVGAGGPFGLVPEGDWDWVIDVNLKGVVYGVEVFAPLLASHGEGGHIVNTASMAGLISPPGMEPYCATKYAVVAMSEGWAAQLSAVGVGVSVLCPGFVDTNIFTSRRNRPTGYGADGPPGANGAAGPPAARDLIPVGPVAARVIEAVKADQFYVFTHPEFRAVVDARHRSILEGFDQADASPALKGLGARPSPELGLDT